MNPLLRAEGGAPKEPRGEGSEALQESPGPSAPAAAVGGEGPVPKMGVGWAPQALGSKEEGKEDSDARRPSPGTSGGGTPPGVQWQVGSHQFLLQSMGQEGRGG